MSKSRSRFVDLVFTGATDFPVRRDACRENDWEDQLAACQPEVSDVARFLAAQADSLEHFEDRFDFHRGACGEIREPQGAASVEAVAVFSEELMQ